MAHTKSLGTTKLGRDSIAKRLGVKINHGEAAKPGQVIIRQRGTRYLPGKNVKLGADDTIYAMKEGKVQFVSRTKTRFDGAKRYVKVVSVQTL